MQLRTWKRIYLTPLVRLNLHTRRLSISFGHRRIGWITFSKRGIRETLHMPVPGSMILSGIPRHLMSSVRLADGRADTSRNRSRQFRFRVKIASRKLISCGIC